MLNFLKNAFFSALLVAGFTVAGVTVAFMTAFFVLTPTESVPEPAAYLFGTLIILALAVLAGMVFSVGTLFAALLTMPPVIWMARVLRLPRPLVDIIGGASAAALCVALALEEMNGGKLAELATPETGYIFKIIGVIAGGLAGYVRYTWLVRPRQTEASALAVAA